MGEKNSMFTTVSVPTSLYKKIEEKIQGTEFTSVPAYIVFVLNEVISDNEEREEFNEGDEIVIKERLKSLGYID